MKLYSLIIISSILLSACGNKKDKAPVTDKPVIATLKAIHSSCYEDSLMNVKMGIEMRHLYFYIQLYNPNDIPVYIPLNTFVQENNRSCFVFYLDNTPIKVNLHSDLENSYIPARDSVKSLVFVIWNFKQTKFAKIHDVRKIAPHLKMEYVKCHTDSLFMHHKIPDVVFRIDDNMKVQYYNSDGHVI
ncbi:MAG: hypothetical protein IJE12_11275 [Prevotella sp.]|nr:hypothetical protein [Prevotella sp.]